MVADAQSIQECPTAVDRGWLVISIRQIPISDIGYWHIGCNLNYRG